MKKLVTAALILALPWSSGTARRPKAVTLAPSLCRPGESALFQCALGNKQVAVCMAGALGVRTVQYRFGRPGKIELSYPVDPGHGPGTLKWASAGFSGGGGMQIHFSHDGTQFVLYSNMVRTGFGADGLNYPMDQLGLFATKGDSLVYDTHCSSHASLAGGHDDWIDEQNTKASLPAGEYIYGPNAFYAHWEKHTPSRH